MPLLILALPLFVTFLQAPAATPLAPADATARARTVLAALAAREFAKVTEQFDDPMKAAVPLERLTAMWTALLAQIGDFKACGDPRVVAVSDKQMVIAPCEFERAKLNLQVAFAPDGRISGLVFRPAEVPAAPYTPPSYADPSSYAETDITVGAGEWTLPGTLTLPNGAGPFPALVLVHGSGPSDRDATLGPNKPFADLALGLATRGIAVLRYDKRSRVHGARMAASPSMTVKEEVIDDVGEAVRMLRARPRIDPAKVFVLGHSLGGMLVPRIASANPTLAGAIVLAGAARPLEDAIVEQMRYLALADGAIGPDEQAQIDAAVKTAAAVKALTPADAQATTRLSNAPPSYWLDLRGYDPPAAARSVKMPLLVLQGERDYQVTMEEFARWKSALAATPTVTFRSYPALNHRFMAGTGKSLPAEYNVPSHVAEEVIRDIAAWIKR